MHLLLYPGFYAVCQVTGWQDIPATGEPLFAARTGDEISLVCRREQVPGNALALEEGWRLLGVKGTLDFSLVGIIAGISAALAGAGVSVFVVSTYNTDYLLVKDSSLEKALEALRSAGYPAEEQS